MTDLVHVIAVGDTRKPLGFKLRTPSKRPIDLTSLTPQVFGFKDDGTVWFALDTGRITKHPLRTFTAAADDWLTDNDNLLDDGDQIIVSSAGTLPAGLVALTRYFSRDVEPNRCKVSLSPGGQPVDITGAGTGVHSYFIVGSGHVTFTDPDVAAAGTFWLWIRPKDAGNAFETFPIVRRANDRALRVEIVNPS